MRPGVLGLVLIAAVTGCTRLPDGTATAPREPVEFALRPFQATPTPAPMLQLQAGYVRALIPHSWEAQPLPQTRFAQEGFIAAPRISDWDRGSALARGMEAFWVDIGKLGIPSDYYYLVARGPALGQILARNRECQGHRHEVLVDHPPDLTGRRFSPSDYVASGRGTCTLNGERMRWAYLVAAPGYGPLREVGIRNSGLYVVVAVVSGQGSRSLLKHMMEGTRFGNASLDQLMSAATATAAA